MHGSAFDVDEMHKDSSQELILCRNVLHQFKDADKQKFLEKAYKILKPGGFFA